ncbi:thiamine diphosphokinase [Polaribacter dokdonensis]|uniref:Thiamine diphosphokinase n=1 Tax=Polaribacter dokdonensis DSW-5 TaxID=1300348 RepID=A0A0M9CF54_9FLAO|nr:thiamine diphosphokinase [Polaribacter dokdonensis]KOY51136.1 Thiamine pyrophosphokinase [Polaribacter dokdonensis DSW-5]SEE17904.1 thiamine pyrophosphokinase [Polaribacter dokdonensis DSW-5]
MKNDNVFLLLNGEKPNSLPDLSKYEIICATDGAYQYLEKNNITPTFIAGDFDSIQTLPNEIEVINTPDQNYTDFDKILQILFDRGFYKVDVYGASGAEQDHFLGNLHTAIQWKSKLNLTFYDYNSKYFLAKNNTKITGCKDQIVSLIPFPKATNILTEGLQYPLKNEDLIFGERIGTRNKAVNNEVTISFTEGNLFIFINH